MAPEAEPTAKPRDPGSDREPLRRLFHAMRHSHQDGLDDYDIQSSPTKQHAARETPSPPPCPARTEKPASRPQEAKPSREGDGRISDRKAGQAEPAAPGAALSKGAASPAEAPACAHMSCGRVGCRRCIEICPSGALFSQQGRVVRRDALCRSCTACLLACPTGSASSLHPERDAPLEPLAARLQSSLASGRLPPWLILSFGDPPAFQDEAAEPGSLSFSMDRWAMAGLELWLAALALGAGGVAILPGGNISASVRGELERQHCLATHILASLGLGEERIRLEKSPASLPSLGPPLPGTEPLPLSAASGASKRELLFKSLQQLQTGSSPCQEAVGLPWDAGFGTVRLDPERCTLCQACVTVCPTGALRAETGGSHSQLLFRELDCIQCGLCREACPEAALELQPRLLLGDEALCFRRICEQELASCPECGRPVAPASLLGSIRQKLRNHWMYREDPAGKRLFLCADCKARAALEA